jgi:hypothetical protein
MGNVANNYKTVEVVVVVLVGSLSPKQLSQATSMTKASNVLLHITDASGRAMCCTSPQPARLPVQYNEYTRPYCTKT